ncbi:Phosphomannomutase [Azospirillaceae bacterium]
MMNSRHLFDKSILREYDIRGILEETLFVSDAYAIGRSFGALLRQRNLQSVCVGYDGRLSSPMLEKALVEGLLESGVIVKRIGLGPTPMLYYATLVLPTDGGIMITGSHNPPNHNGFKMMMKGAPFFGQDILTLGEIASEGAWVDGKGTSDDISVMNDYIQRISSDYDSNQGLSVAWDTGNGAAGEAINKLTARLPGRHILLNDTIDGTFPSHHPDPTEPHTLEQLIATVKEHNLDLGIAFDGDGDRIGVIDNLGRILWGDQLMMLYAEDVLSRHPGATIIADCKASQSLFDRIAELGGKPLMWKTGHSLIKKKMVETGSPLAGEMSGHIFFKDGYYGFDDALYAAVRLLSSLSKKDEPLSAWKDRLPVTFSTPELRFPCSDVRKFEIISEVKKRLLSSGCNVNEIDGVRVQTSDGWWLLRASNTQAVLVARCESTTKEGLERLQHTLNDQILESGIDFYKSTSDDGH